MELRFTIQDLRFKGMRLAAVLFVSCLLLLVVSASATAAPTYDDSTVNTDSAGRSSASFSHTVTGTDNVLLVSVIWGASGNETVTGVTYNSVSATSVRSSCYSASNRCMEVFKLADPATSANTVQVNWSGSVDYSAVTAASYSGADDVSLTSDVGATGAGAVDVSPASDLDDGQVDDTTFYATDYDDSWVGVGSGGNSQYVWRRYPNVTLPPGSIITSAYITETKTSGGAGTNVLTKIRAIDEDDHTAPTNYSSWNSDHGAHTTAAVDWDFTQGSSGTIQSPDISAVIQEIVDRSGWSSGADIGLHIDDDGSATNTFQAFTDYDVSASTLHIEYSPGVLITPGDADSMLVAFVDGSGGDTDPFGPGSGITEREDGATGTGTDDYGGSGTITLVGTAQAGNNANGGNVTLNFDGTRQQDDVVILIGGGGTNDAGDGWGPVTAGYTQLAFEDWTMGENLALGVWYKVLGASPDSSVTGNGGGDATDGVTYASYVLRGVDTSNVEDVAEVLTSGSGTNPDLAAISTATDNAWVFAAAIRQRDNTASSAPGGYSGLATTGVIDTVRSGLAAAYKEVAMFGSENPGAFTWSSNATWKGYTFAIRPGGAVADADDGYWMGEKAATSTMAHTMDATMTTSDDWAIIAVEITEAAGGGGGGTITQVGTTQCDWWDNGTSVTLTFDGSPAEDDVVVLVGGGGTSDSGDTWGPSTAGYTQLAFEDWTMDEDLALGVWTKVLGASPDVTVTGQGGDTTDGVVYCSYVLRGVDTSNIEDVAEVLSSGSSSVPNTASITTVTDGAWVFSAGMTTWDATASGAPSGYSGLGTTGATDTERAALGVAYKEVATAGAENPGAFSWGSYTWKGYTFAIRPAASGTFTEVQTVSGTNDASAGDLTVNLGSNAVAGNLLVAYFFHRPSGEPTVPSGFTEMVSVEDTTNADWFKGYYKVAAGGESSVTFDVVGGDSNDYQVGIVTEYSGFSGTPTLDKTAVNGPINSSTTAATGTTAALTQQPALAVAGWSFRSTGSTTSTADSYTNSYVELLEDNDGSGMVAHHSYLTAASVELTSTSATDSTVTISDAGRLMGGVATFYDASVGVTFARVQDDTAEGTNPTATYGATPTDGNLLIAIATERNGNSHTGWTMPMGWTKRIGHDAELMDSNARRTMAVWSKVAGASEPTNVQVTGNAATKLTIQEFEAGTSVTWTFEDESSADTGTGSTSPLGTGSTSSIGAGDLLLITSGIWRNDTGNPTSIAWSGIASMDIINSLGAGNGRTVSSGFAQESAGGTKSSSLSWGTSGHEATAGILVFSASTGGNTAPSITGTGCGGSAYSDSPDPVNETDDVDFCVDWDDPDAGDTDVEIYVCKTIGITPGTGCDGGGSDTWVSLTGETTDPATQSDGLSYTTLTSEAGATQNYHIYVCDDEPECSAVSSGTFAVNDIPVHDVGVTDTPDPVLEGANAVFTVDWTDADDATVDIIICKSDAVTVADPPTCPGGQWVLEANTTENPDSDIAYATGEADSGAGALSYYAFVCDQGKSCSASSSGTFTVNEQTMVIDAFTPNPASGPDPLDVYFDVDLNASRTANGTINFSVWWDCAGQDAEENVGTVEGACGALPAPSAGSCASNAAGYKCNAVADTDSQRIPTSGTQQYSGVGAYNAKVIVEQGLADAANNVITTTTTVTVTNPPPSVTTVIPPTSITQTSATLEGSANPNNDATTGYFYWHTSTFTCDAGGVGAATRLPPAGGDALGSGSSPVPYDEPLGSLSANTTYFYCAVADNGTGTGYGTTEQFTTLADVPTEVETDPVSDLASYSATLEGLANPNGGSTTGYFRYSTGNPGSCNDVFGTRVPASGGVDIGSGTTQTSFNNGVSGLNDDTTYYYCALAENTGGVTPASDLIESFHTPFSLNDAPSISGVVVSPDPSFTSDRVLSFGDTFFSAVGLNVANSLTIDSAECPLVSTIGIVQQASGGADAATDVVATLGAAPTAGNVLVAVHAVRGTVAASAIDGFTLAHTQQNTVSGRGSNLGIYTKTATGSEGAITFSLASAEDQLLMIFEVAGILASDILDVATGTSSGSATSFATGSVFSTSKNTYGFAAAMKESGSSNHEGQFAWDNGFYAIDRFNFASVDANLSVAMQIADEIGSFSSTETFAGAADEGTAAIAILNIQTQCDDVLPPSTTGTPNVALVTEPTEWFTHLDVVAEDIAVGEYVGSDGTGCDDSEWDCTTVVTQGATTDIAVGPDGSVSMAYVTDNPDGELYIADYVKSGGTGCASSAWTCTAISGATHQFEGREYHDLSLIYTPNGTRWIFAEEISSGSNVTGLQEVGSGGSCPDNTAWDCHPLGTWSDDTLDIVADAFGDIHIAFGGAAVPGDLVYGKFVGSGGETTVCPGAAWECESAWDDLSLGGTHEMDIEIDPTTGIPWIITAASDTDGMNTDGFVVARRDGGNSGCTHSAWTCEVIYQNDAPEGTGLAITPNGTVWGAYSEAGVGPWDLTVIQHVGGGAGDCPGDSDWECTTVVSTLTARRAVDVWIHTDGNPWVLYDDVDGDGNGELFVAKYVGSGGTGCDDTAWTCSALDRNIVSAAARHASAAVSNLNQLQEEVWISHHDDTTGMSGKLLASHYVGADGNCDDVAWGDAGSDAWDCFQIDDGGDGSAMAIDAHGTPWIAYADGSNDLAVAWYTGDGQGFGCADTSNWTCKPVITTGDVDANTIDSAFDLEDNLWITFRDRTGDDLYVAWQTDRYEETWTGGCPGQWDSGQFSCQLIHDGSGATGTGVGVSLTIDPTTGYPWISYTRSSALWVARWAGEGLGSGCTRDEWTCEEVDGAGGNATGIVIGPAGASGGDLWVSYRESGTSNLHVANYIGGGSGSGCTDNDWDCIQLRSSGASGTGQFSGISWNYEQDWPVAAFYQGNLTRLDKAWRVGSGGSCDDATWGCAAIDEPGIRGRYPSITHPGDRDLDWIAYSDVTNNDLWVAVDQVSGGTGCSETTSSDCYQVLSVSGGGAGFKPSIASRSVRVAAITQVQAPVSVGSSSLSSTIQATYGTAPTQGNTLIAVHAHGDSNIATPPAGWTRAAELAGGQSGSSRIGIWYKLAGASESSNVQFSISPASEKHTLSIFEYAGIAEVSPVDKTSSGAQPSGQPSDQVIPHTPQTEQADELILAAAFMDEAVTWDEGWNNPFSQQAEVESTGMSYNLDMVTAHRIARARDQFRTTVYGDNPANGAGVIATFRAKTGSVPFGPRVESVSEWNSGATASSFELVAPEGIADDDLLLAQAAISCGSCMTGNTISPPMGWTEIYHQDRGDGSGASGFWYKVVTDAASEPTTYTFTPSNSGRGGVSIARISGADTSNPIGVSQVSSGTGVQITSPSVTTTVASSLVYRTVASDQEHVLSPAGQTQLVESARAFPGNQPHAVYAVLQASTGASGSFTMEQGPSSGSWEAATVAITPASDGGTIEQVQSKSASYRDAAPSVTLDAGATAGNLLVATLGGRSAIGTSVPSGWTIAVEELNGDSDTSAIYYKVAVGGETTINFNYTSGRGGVTVTEWSHSNGWGSDPLDQAHTEPACPISWTCSTGDVSVTKSVGLVIASFGIGNADEANVRAYTNSFTEDGNACSGGCGTTEGRGFTASRVVASSGTYETTVDMTGSTAGPPDAQAVIASFVSGGGSGIAVSHLTSGLDEDGNDNAVSEQIWPSANALVLAAIATSYDDSAPTMLSGNGLTWVQIGEAAPMGGNRLTLFRAMGSAPTLGSVTIDLNPDTQDQISWVIMQFRRVDTSGTNGSGAIEQIVVDDTATNTTSHSVALTSFADATNNVAYGTFLVTNDSVGITPEAGYHEIFENSSNQVQDISHSAQWILGEDTSVSATWTGNEDAYGIAVEINAAGAACAAGGSPTVEDTVTSVDNVGTTKTVTLPSGIQADDLILIIGAESEGTDRTFTPPMGYTEIGEYDQSNDAGMVVAYRYATGGESGTVDFTLGGAGGLETVWVAYRISGAEDPATQVPEVSTVAGSTTGNANPNSVTPTGGAKDYLFFSVGAYEHATSLSSPSSGYSNAQSVTDGSAQVALGSGERQVNAASEDPGTMSFNIANDNWAAITIAVHPTSGASCGENVSGIVESVTLDTRSPEGASLNNLLWYGTRPASSSVRMWIATANCPNGETDPKACTTPADANINADFTGTDSDPWPSGQWTTSVTGGGVAEIEYNQGNLEHPATHNSSARAISTMPPITDSEVLLRYRFASTSGESHARVCLRGSTDGWFDYDKPDDAYCFRHVNTSATVALYSYVNGTESSLDTQAGFTAQETWWSLRFQVEDNDIRYKVWPAEEAEPSAWTGEVIDNNDVSGTGALMLSFAENHPGTDQAEEFYFDDIRLRNLDVVTAADATTESQWTFYGESCTIDQSPFTPAPGTPIELPRDCTDGSGESIFQNRRYFRYRLELCANSSCSATGSTPTVDDVVVNWST